MPRAGDMTWNFFVATDAERYSQGDTGRQADLQDALVEALSAAAERAGLNRARWNTQQSGDGELARLHGDQSAPRVVDDFVRELDAWLEEYNCDRRHEARLRLRVAMHHGSSSPAGNGFAGPAPIVVARLVNARSARLALANAENANLVLIISTRVFEDIVLQRCTSLRPEEFVRVDARDEEKDFAEIAWIRVPRLDAAHTVTGSDMDRDGPNATTGLVLVLRPDDGDRNALQEAVANAFDSDGYHADLVDDQLIVRVRPTVPGARVTGVWLEKLRQSVRQRVRIGIADGDIRFAGELARAEMASQLLDAAPSCRTVVAVSDEVYRSAVLPGGRKVAPDSYVRITSGPDGWIRVPGYSIPPSPLRTVRPPAPHRPAADPGGPVVRIGRATIGGNHVDGGTQFIGTMNQYNGGEHA